MFCEASGGRTAPTKRKAEAGLRLARTNHPTNQKRNSGVNIFEQINREIDQLCAPDIDISDRDIGEVE